MKNKRGFIMPWGVVLLTLMVIIIVIAHREGEINELAKIGEQQNQMLDSYTVAEGARLYIETSAKYAAQAVETDCSDANFLKEFRSNFAVFLENAPDENMGLTIKYPLYTFTVEDNILHGHANPNYITVSNNKDKFKITTTVIGNFKLDCEDI